MEKILLELAAHTIWEKKGENILVLDVRHLTTLTEYFIIASGNVDRHVTAMAEAVIEKFKKEGITPFGVEGMNEGDWVVVDFGDLYLHVFTHEGRDRYRLENVWSDSEIVDIEYPKGEPSMTKKRIAVTGLGVVSCFGNDVEEFHRSLTAGKSGVRPIHEFPHDDFPTQFAAKINEFDPGEYIDKKQARRIDPFIAYTFVAGKKAIEMAALPDSLPSARAGIIIGSGMGGLHAFTDAVHTLRDKGVKRMSPFFIPYVITNMGSALLAIEKGYTGPNYSVSTACATANYSIVNAAEHIRRGDVDVMVCGGAEAAINSMGVAGFSACRALSKRNDDPQRASRPWDKGRDGFVIGEGAGVLVLESWEHAKARGATIYAEYLGGAFSTDAYHMTEPRADGEGVAQCVQGALKDAGIDESAIDYINAHATSTPAGDMAEVNALKKVFKNPGRVFMNGTKSMIGHALGAAGGLEAVATILQLRDGVIHPTLNLDDPEEGIEFKVSNQVQKGDIQRAISNSFGFGGHNASVIFGKGE